MLICQLDLVIINLLFSAVVCMCGTKPRKKSIVIVVSQVSPLVNLVKDQISLLLSLGISATSLNNETSEADKRKFESGQYSIVYGSQESWLGDTRWRKILSSETYENSVRVVAVDEAHVICHL